MIGLELVCLAIVVTYIVARLARANRRRAFSFIARFATLALASFAGEDTVIRAYGTYAYATGWSVRLDHVPLVIVLVWPVVIDSAGTLARAILETGGRAATPLRVASLGAAIVLADASLIEPIAVRAGLWRWTDLGLFGVPLIGIAGWAFFAWAALLVLETAHGAMKLVVIAMAPLTTHAMILVSWWLAFRWLGGERSGVAASGLAWGAAVVVAAMVVRGAARGRGLAMVPIGELLVRLPGALFFFVLLGLTAHEPSAFAAPDARLYAPPSEDLHALAAYAAAFAPPYLAALAMRALRDKSARSRALA